MTMYIPIEEQETIITFNEKDQTANVYTMNKALTRKLDGLTVTRADDARRVKTYSDGAQEYVVPKKWVKVNAGPVLTDAQRKAKVESVRAARIAKFGKNP